MTSKRVAIVTGGAGPGIGGAISKLLATRGWFVLVADRDQAHIDQLISEIGADHESLRTLTIDLTDEVAPQLIVNTALEQWGRIDAVVLNAGIGCVGAADSVSDASYDGVFAVNVRAVYRVAREAASSLTRPGGTLVTLASVHGRQPAPGYCVYAATKGAIESLTRGMAVDFGKFGIRVNCVVPGMVDCPQTRAMTSKITNDVDGYLAQWASKRQLVPSLVTSQNVAELVVFLLSDMSQGVTGQSIVIDAGTTLMLTDRD